MALSMKVIFRFEFWTFFADNEKRNEFVQLYRHRFSNERRSSEVRFSFCQSPFQEITSYVHEFSVFAECVWHGRDPEWDHATTTCWKILKKVMLATRVFYSVTHSISFASLFLSRKCSNKHLYTHALRIKIRFCPRNRNSYETDAQINSVRKTRLQLLLCKTSIDIFEKTLLTLFWKCTYELSRSRFTPQFAIFAEPLHKRKANGKRRSFRVRGSNVEAEVAEVVFRN